MPGSRQDSITSSWGSVSRFFVNLTIPPSHLELVSDATGAKALGFEEDDVLTVPIAIAQRDVVAGTVFFQVAQELLAETRIEAYTVSLIDTFDRESMKEVLLLPERPVEE